MQLRTSELPGRHTRRRLLGTLAIVIAMLLVGGLAFIFHFGQSSVSAHPVRSPLAPSVYIGSAGGTLYKVDAASGTLLWSTVIGGRSIPSAPAVANGNVYVGSLRGDLVALHADTGAVTWRYRTGGAILASPVVVKGVVYVGSSDGYLYAIDAKSGSLHWHHRAGPANDAMTVFGPGVANGLVIAASSDEVAKSYVFAVNASTGAEVWRVSIAHQLPSDVKIVNGTVYLAATALSVAGGPTITDSYIYAFNAKDGSKLWRSSKIGAQILVAPTVANGHVYTGAQDGTMVAFDAKTGAQTWRHNANGPIYASPQIVNGVVYFGVGSTVHDNKGTSHSVTVDATKTDGAIIALDATTGSLRWRHQLAGYDGASFMIHGNALFVA
ncbi:MAG: PQQ-binding-like beta-propeller repeat protein, partial [Ktedonobacteraceae bacterium]|nr:PQQ-binding-like beta-propeller repeat protein [Ktedonobacteraceae bacterium]